MSITRHCQMMTAGLQVPANGELLARQVEQAYREMWQGWCAEQVDK